MFFGTIGNTGDGQEFSRQWAQLLKNELETNLKYQQKYHVVHTASYPNSNTTTLAQYADSVAKNGNVQSQLVLLKAEWEDRQAKLKAEADARANSVEICSSITIVKNATDAEKYKMFQLIFKDKSVSAECRNKLWPSISKSYRDMKEGEYLRANPNKVVAALNQAWNLSPIPAAKSDGTQLVCRIQNGAEAIAIESSRVSSPKCPNQNTSKECFYNDVSCEGPDGKSVGMVSCPSIDGEGDCPCTQYLLLPFSHHNSSKSD